MKSAHKMSAWLVCSVLATKVCMADEAGVPVTIKRFDRESINYTLVVNPAKTQPPDRFMGACERFEVRGTYGVLNGAKDNADWLSRKAHREALDFVQQAFVTGQVIDLGWVGSGFVPVEASNPCVVKSRALRLVKDDLGTHVVSYYDAIS